MNWYATINRVQSGPMSFEDLKSLAASGALGPMDGVWQEGTPDWRAASQVPGLGIEGPPAADYSRPPGPGQAPAQAPAAATGFDPLKLVVPLQTSALAIAAGYLGLLSLVGCPGPVAIIVSLLALRDLKRRPEMDGKGRAWFGLVMGIIGTLLLLFVLVLTIAGNSRPSG